MHQGCQHAPCAVKSRNRNSLLVNTFWHAGEVNHLQKLPTWACILLYKLGPHFNHFLLYHVIVNVHQSWVMLCIMLAVKGNRWSDKECCLGAPLFGCIKRCQCKNIIVLTICRDFRLLTQAYNAYLSCLALYAMNKQLGNMQHFSTYPQLQRHLVANVLSEPCNIHYLTRRHHLIHWKCH